ncbi:hypothetical protein KC660_02575 [Candidatus Dojkabacteria bacterium]|uniref:Uncharacterized protein n=1 Tax=Candidatus Dojkabacteria bacterium TaxID=2099670 RepID=A0A955RHV4_9BACT|nr:hypothetical protein [Candidatus Dojkabacteria bacterium]
MADIEIEGVQGPNRRQVLQGIGLFALSSLAAASCAPPMPAQSVLETTPLAEPIVGDKAVREAIYTTFQANAGPVIGQLLERPEGDIEAEIVRPVVLVRPGLLTNQVDGNTSEAVLTAAVQIYQSGLEGTLIGGRWNNITFLKTLRAGAEMTIMQESGDHNFSLLLTTRQQPDNTWVIEIASYGRGAVLDLMTRMIGVDEQFSIVGVDQATGNVVLIPPAGIDPDNTFPVIDLGVPPLSDEVEGTGRVLWLHTNPNGEVLFK